MHIDEQAHNRFLNPNKLGVMHWQNHLNNEVIHHDQASILERESPIDPLCFGQEIISAVRSSHHFYFRFLISCISMRKWLALVYIRLSARIVVTWLSYFSCVGVLLGVYLSPWQLTTKQDHTVPAWLHSLLGCIFALPSNQWRRLTSEESIVFITCVWDYVCHYWLIIFC